MEKNFSVRDALSHTWSRVESNVAFMMKVFCIIIATYSVVFVVAATVFAGIYNFDLLLVLRCFFSSRAVQ